MALRHLTTGADHGSLERIGDIVGPFVDDADRCLTLGLAIRLRRSLGRGPVAH
jgi:hypothetical protein